MQNLIYSTSSHRKIVHFHDCPVVRHVKEENRRSFVCLKEARTHGYRLCRCCSPLTTKYRKERSQVDAFCRAKGFIFRIKDEALHVISRHDCWQIIANGNHRQMFLYHKDTGWRYEKDTQPSMVPGYHPQRIRCSTIMGYLECIASHDEYRDQHFCTEKVSRKMDRVCAPLYEEGRRNRPGCLPRHRSKKKKDRDAARRRSQERRVGMIRVNALLEEMAVIGY